MQNMCAAAACALALSLLAGAATAADLPSRKGPVAPYVVPPAFTWAGPYLGVYAGGGFGSSRNEKVDAFGHVNVDTSGVALGGLAGYNFQFHSFVLGAEGEFGWNNQEGSSLFTSSSRFGDFLTGTSKLESSYVGRGRLRVGYAFDNFLLFLAGGASFTDSQLTLSTSFGPSAACPVCLGGTETNSLTKDRVGWNIGAGVDWAFYQNWVGRLEYIHDEYGSETFGFAAASNGFWADRKAKYSNDTVRAALMYKFW